MSYNDAHHLTTQRIAANESLSTKLLYMCVTYCKIAFPKTDELKIEARIYCFFYLEHRKTLQSYIVNYLRLFEFAEELFFF